MKKTTTIILFILVLMVPAATLSADGIGFILGEPTGLSYKTENIVINLGWSFTSGTDNRIDATADWWLINKNLEILDVFDWYFGVGVKAGIKTNQGNDNTDTLGLGVRFPIGVQFWLPDDLSAFELFAELVPGISVFPTFGFDPAGGIGLRYHF
ncbi:MAG: hypothetical protein KAH95_16205 [Spirochaetales bacterium]|nr:hypothetical protein [Spirochaetales bacterium]